MEKSKSAVCQALQLFDKMGIKIQHEISSTKIYVFEYERVMMLMHIDSPDDQIELGFPFFLEEGSESFNRQTFDIIKEMTSNDLKDYYMEYVGNGVVFVDKVWVCYKRCKTLRKYELIKMMKDVCDAYYTLLAALSLVRMSSDMVGVNKVSTI